MLTAGLMVLVFLWLRKIPTPWMSLLLTLTGAFATMLWPYAYIGLETKQSFFILLVGYLALANGKIRSWRGLVLFGIAGGLSLTIKGYGNCHVAGNCLAGLCSIPMTTGGSGGCSC